MTGSINRSLYQISQVSDGKYNIVNLYLSKGANKQQFLHDLRSLVTGISNCVIVGDFNIDYLLNPNEMVISTLKSKGFTQLIETPTHTCGGLLDHVYTKQLKNKLETSLNFPYFSDHALISVMEI